MEKEINLLNHDTYTMKMLATQDKIIVTTLSCILPLIAIIESYQYLSSSLYFWLVLVLLVATLGLNFYFWNSKTFSLVIVTQFLLAGTIIGAHVFLSMAKGIELLSGPQEGTFFSFPMQYGLLNLKDGTIAFIVLIYSVAMLSYFIFKRRDVEVGTIFSKKDK